ncbi:MFS transporter [Patulibacter defluvii]|uniref:MFS transporter n=1 Tax=Patulibacter defluvii TaxID=3095358 RepID=UPI002A761114|nr:MFS transporter [Patulibacter sp. DM4]
MSADRPSPLPLLLACGGSFLAFLDVTITNLAVPDLARDLGTGVTTLSWVVTLYTVLLAALLAPAGRVADVLGRRRLFAIGVSLFTLASLAAALAPGLGALLAARAVQGAGAAAMIPASLAFVLADTAPERRTVAIGLWSAAASVAAALGPSLGGILVEAFGWRALFLVNVPAGAALAWLALRAPTVEARRERLPDALGTALVAVAVGLLVLAVTEGERWGWGDPRTLTALAAALVAGGWALGRSRVHPAPALQIDLWRSRSYAAANAVSLLFGAALYAWLLIGVLFLTGVWAYSPLEAGFAMTHGAIASAAVGVAIGRARRRPSPRTLVVGGALLMAATGAAIAIALPAEPAFLALWLPAGLVGGAGMGAVSVGASTAAALAVAPPRFAAATGLNIAARQIGGAIGVALLAALLAGRDGHLVAPFADVYLVCAGASLLAAGAGLRLRAAAPSALPSAPPLPAR